MRVSQVDLSLCALSLIPLSLVALLAPACGAPAEPVSVATARHHYETGDFQSAERVADDELRATPSEASLWRVKINAAIRAGQHERGVQSYLQWHRQRRHYDVRAIRSMAISTLWHALVADGRESRVQALQALRSVRAPELSGDVAERVRDPDPLVAGLAAAIAGGAPGRERVRSLLASADGTVRAQVIGALPRSFRDSLGPQVLAQLGDGASEVRKAAAAAVGRFQLKSGARQVLHLAARDPDGKVRAAALSALARLGIRSVASRGEPDVIAVARAGLQDDYLGARLAALAILAARPGEHRDVLANAARASDSFLALRAAVALRKTGREVPINTLQLALAHRQWSVRAAALNAIGRLLPARDALGLIENRLTDSRIEVRLAAARALANLGHKSRARAVFVAALGADRDLPRLQAAIALIRMKDDLGRDALSKLCTSRSPDTRRQAALAHGLLDGPTMPLIRALGDSELTVRIAAAVTVIRSM